MEYLELVGVYRKDRFSRPMGHRTMKAGMVVIKPPIFPRAGEWLDRDSNGAVKDNRGKGLFFLGGSMRIQNFLAAAAIISAHVGPEVGTEKVNRDPGIPHKGKAKVKRKSARMARRKNRK